jgi:glycine/D-amino acid oxidase-like deaminating enzyme
VQDRQAQVVVIGAGFAGASTAFHLACAGVHEIVVCEAEATTGYHASGRNAALCRQLVEDELITDLTMEGASFLTHPPEGFSSRPLLRAGGSLLLSNRAPTLEDLLARAQRRGVAHEAVGMDWILRRWPRLAGLPALGGVFCAKDGVIDTHGLLQAFLGGARARGAQVDLNCAVKAFRKGRDGGVLVDTTRGTIQASVVVNAAGAWVGEIGRLAGSADIVFTPMHRHLHRTERVPNLDRSLPYVWFLDPDDEFYVRVEDDGFLFSACDSTPALPGDARVLPEAELHLERKLKRLTPWLCEFRITRSWACLRTFSPDGRPFVGWDHKVPWLFWVAGLGGHGATSSAAVGRVASDLIRQGKQ